MNLITLGTSYLFFSDSFIFNLFIFVIGLFHLANVHRFTHVIVCVRKSFLFKAIMYVYITVWSSIRPLMDTWAASTFWVLEISLLWTHIVNEHLFETLLSIIFSIHPEAELMEHIIILFLIFLRTAIWFTIAAAPYSIPTSSAWGIRISPHHHQCLLLSVF